MVSDVNINTVLGQQQNTANASSKLAEDFSQFLTLLTTQLQNQDPLSPMDTTEFTNQLVAFTGVEQQINTNQKLDSLVSLQLGASFSEAQNYVGLEVSYISSEMAFDGITPAKISYAVDGNAAISQINIRDASGDIVYTADAAKSGGPHEFIWDGRMNGGGTAPEGTYEVTVDALDIDGNAVSGTTVVRGLVRGVETQSGQIYLLVGERAVPVSNILNTDVPNGGLNDNSALTTALSYIGLDISYLNSKLNFNGTDEAEVEYTLESDADRAQFLVFNDNGQVIYSEDVPTDDGTYTFSWDGTLNDGSLADEGSYTFVVDAIDDNDARVTVTSYAQGRVSGIETKGGQIYLEIEEGVIALSNVTSISQPSPPVEEEA